MNLFLDCEFTTLNPGSKLISIALVDENEEYFYVELSDSYRIRDCSKFVKKNVLLHLLGGEFLMTTSEAIIKMGNWIESRNTECTLVSDAPGYDGPLIWPLLDVCWPVNLVQGIYPVYFPKREQETFAKLCHLKFHFALHDAVVNKRMFIDPENTSAFIL